MKNDYQTRILDAIIDYCGSKKLTKKTQNKRFHETDMSGILPADMNMSDKAE